MHLVSHLSLKWSYKQIFSTFAFEVVVQTASADKRTFAPSPMESRKLSLQILYEADRKANKSPASSV